MTLGGNPLFGDGKDTTPGFFETRIEIYSPPYLYHEARPTITGGPRQLSRGGTYSFATPDASAIAGARLLAPSTSFGLIPSGWYMLFVTNAENTPSTAYWVHLS